MVSSLILRTACLAAAAINAAAACPGGAVAAHDRCWYQGAAGASCGETCQAKGLSYSHHVPGEADPMVPKLLGRAPGTRQIPWGRIECYVPSQDRYHTAKNVQDTSTGDRGQPQDWKEGICALSCGCSQDAAQPPADASAPYPGCVKGNEVLRHAGAHAIFVDVSTGGSWGCWQNDCKNTDKFNAKDMGVCARMCAAEAECTHWSFGEQDGAKKCFFRKSDAGREGAEGFFSASKSCAPATLPDALLALKASEMLLPCDSGKSDACPDMARAVSTWRFAIKHLQKAVAGKIDENTAKFVNDIAADIESFAAQMGEENFPVIAANNRQVFNALSGWLQSQGIPAVPANDASLPDPLRGQLCGPNHCYEL